MKTPIALLAASVVATGAYAAQPNDSFMDNHDTSDTVLLDVGHHSGVNPIREPSGDLVPIMASGSNFGSVLFDLDQPSSSRTLSTQPAIGDAADDYGNILYDSGARY